MKKLIMISLLLSTASASANRICNLQLAIKARSFTERVATYERESVINCENKTDEKAIDKYDVDKFSLDFEPKVYSTLKKLKYKPLMPCTQSSSTDGYGSYTELLRSCVFYK